MGDRGAEKQLSARPLSRPPMIRDLFVIQVPDASDKGRVTVRLRPIDCFFLSFESAEHLARMVFDYIGLNGRSFRAALGTGFHVHASIGRSKFGCFGVSICMKKTDPLIFRKTRCAR